MTPERGDMRPVRKAGPGGGPGSRALVGSCTDPEFSVSFHLSCASFSTL